MADDGLVSIADQFKGLPMEDLIGGPLAAACKANLSLANATADYIQRIGFMPPVLDKDGKPVGAVTGGARMVDFEFERPGQSLDDGSPTVETVKLKVPMLAIVPIPNLQIDSVDITFDMEVKSSTSEKSSKDSEGSFSADAKVGWGCFSLSVHVEGKVASHQENARSSDNSARYHVEVHAKNAGMPEGLSRVLDIMASAATPRSIEARPMINTGGDADPKAAPKLVDTSSQERDLQGTGKK
ncbi:DUF2589 domain-containing protein [Prosthecobacter sp.]|uniref:DUF2589 domain-containing protein n=1 Tax=Prosthecobacter sp. TaxID=1965333 RepID=UPI0024896095|nr:DUF2589 domain-containing protein [Prosthecobacter sp.]MDI1312055.1 DUF2589 domain-containing protein [Prosthecobacter sp.]